MNSEKITQFVSNIQRIINLKQNDLLQYLIQNFNKQDQLEFKDVSCIEPSQISYEINSLVSYNVDRNSASYLPSQQPDRKNQLKSMRKKEQEQQRQMVISFAQQQHDLDDEIKKIRKISKYYNEEDENYTKLNENQTKQNENTEITYSDQEDDNFSLITTQKIRNKQQIKKRSCFYQPTEFQNSIQNLIRCNSKNTVKINYQVQEKLPEFKKSIRIQEDASLLDSTYTNNFRPGNFNTENNMYQANVQLEKYQNQKQIQNDEEEENLFDTMFSTEKKQKYNRRQGSFQIGNLSSKDKQNLEIFSNKVQKRSFRINCNNEHQNSIELQTPRFAALPTNRFEPFFETKKEIMFEKINSIQSLATQNLEYEIFTTCIQKYTNKIYKTFYEQLHKNYRIFWIQNFYNIASNIEFKHNQKLIKNLTSFQKVFTKLQNSQKKKQNQLIQKNQQNLCQKVVQNNMLILKTILEGIIKEKLFDSFYQILIYKQNEDGCSDLTSNYDYISRKSNIKASKGQLHKKKTQLFLYSIDSCSNLGSRATLNQIQSHKKFLAMFQNYKIVEDSKQRRSIGQKIIQKQIDKKLKIIKFLEQLYEVLQLLEKQFAKNKKKHSFKKKSTMNERKFTSQRQKVFSFNRGYGKHKKQEKELKFFERTIRRIFRNRVKFCYIKIKKVYKLSCRQIFSKNQLIQRHTVNQLKTKQYFKKKQVFSLLKNFQNSQLNLINVYSYIC